jgi:hypothetical protein
LLLDEAWISLTAGEAEPSPQRPSLDLAIPVSRIELGSRLPVTDTAVACIGLSLLAAVALVEQSDDRLPKVSLHPGHVAGAITSERHFRIDGQPSPLGFAPLSRFWQTNDG